MTHVEARIVTLLLRGWTGPQVAGELGLSQGFVGVLVNQLTKAGVKFETEPVVQLAQVQRENNRLKQTIRRLEGNRRRRQPRSSP